MCGGEEGGEGGFARLKLVMLVFLVTMLACVCDEMGFRQDGEWC